MSLTTESKMAEEKEEWTEIELPDKEVEYEVEEEEQETVETVAEEKPDVQEEKPEVQEEKPAELEGIETKGAEKRIRQLIKQRKERDEQIEELIRHNEQLVSHLQYKDQEVFNVSKNSLEVSEKQLTDKLELARQAYMEAFEGGEKEKVL